MRNACQLLAALLLIAAPSFAQKTESLVSVPFVGCPADGQQGPVATPKGHPKLLHLTPEAAAQLAWYQTAEDGGDLCVLAPRGWHCFGTYGSNGQSLYVAPEPLNADKLIFQKGWNGFQGPAVQLSVSIGDTSGRFEVARIVARVFPAYRAYARRVITEKLEPTRDFPFGPWPGDKLIYKSNHLVEFITPPDSNGLGTASWLTRGPDPISGFAMLVGEDTDPLLLDIRLPPALISLGPVIVAEAEREAAQP